MVEKEKNLSPTPFTEGLKIIFDNNPAIPFMELIVRSLTHRLDDETIMQAAGMSGAFNLPEISDTGNVPYIEAMNRLLLVMITQEESPDFIHRLADPGIEDLTSAAIAQHSAEHLARKSRKFEIRGSTEKLRRLGVPPGYFSPQRIAREIDVKQVQIEDEPDTRTKRIFDMVKEGPNVDIESGILPGKLLKHTEETLEKALILDSEPNDLVKADLIRFPLKGVTHPSDPRSSFLVRLRVNPTDDNVHDQKRLTMSFNWTDREDGGDNHAYDGRNPGYYYLEQYRSEIRPDSMGKLNLHPLDLPEDCPEGTIYFFGDTLASQSFSHITRFILDQCAFGDQILLRNFFTDQTKPITMEKLLKGVEMWDEEVPGMPEEFKEFYNQIPSIWDEFRFDTFRGDEYVSRLMVAYGLDPFRFVAATYATGLLPHLKLHGNISQHGGIDTWARKIAKIQGIEITEDTKTSEILSELSAKYRREREEMKPEEYSWFTSKYFDPLDEYQLDWADSIDLVTPWFMDPYAREPLDKFYNTWRKPNVRIVGDQASQDPNKWPHRKWSF